MSRVIVEREVAEAARRFMAAHLRAERAAGDDVGETVRVFDLDDALQELRDTLAQHSRVRVRR